MNRVDDTKTALYRHFDAHGSLLYVGISLSAAARLSQHMAGAKWAMDIARVDVEHFPSRELAEAKERAVIKAEKPAWNRAHSTLFSSSRKPGKRSLRHTESPFSSQEKRAVKIGDLSASAKRVFAVARKSETTAGNTSRFGAVLHFSMIDQDAGAMSQSSYSRAIQELVAKGMLARSICPGMVFINPAFYSNATRTKQGAVFPTIRASAALL